MRDFTFQIYNFLFYLTKQKL